MIVVDKLGVTQDGGCGGRFGVDRDVGQQVALRMGEGAGDQMQRRQCDERVSEAAQTIDEDALYG